VPARPAEGRFVRPLVDEISCTHGDDKKTQSRTSKSKSAASYSERLWCADVVVVIADGCWLLKAMPDDEKLLG
jgi:hypothetical protein